MILEETTEFVLISRLFFAGVLGAVVGLERELRAKEAGLRTHFLVSLGSALFMIISQYGFTASGGIDGILPGDASRVAAQIVTGIGFIGAGAIMVHKHYVYGLTTAAGLWVVAAIGMAVGGGLYILAVFGTLFALIGLELFRVLTRWARLHSFDVTFTADNSDAIDRMIRRIKEIGCSVARYKIVSCSENSSMRVVVSIRARSKGDDANMLVRHLKGIDGVKVKAVE